MGTSFVKFPLPSQLETLTFMIFARTWQKGRLSHVAITRWPWHYVPLELSTDERKTIDGLLYRLVGIPTSWLMSCQYVRYWKSLLKSKEGPLYPWNTQRSLSGDLVDSMAWFCALSVLIGWIQLLTDLDNSSPSTRTAFSIFLAS